VVIFSFKAYDTAESFLRKSLMQENLRKKTCASYLRKFHMTHLQVEQRSCRLKVAFYGRYCIVIPMDHSQLAICERRLSGIELILFLKVFASKNLCILCKCVCHIWKFSFKSGFQKWLSQEKLSDVS